MGYVLVVGKLFTQLNILPKKRDINNAIVQRPENPQPPAGKIGQHNDPDQMSPQPEVIIKLWMSFVIFFAFRFFSRLHEL